MDIWQIHLLFWHSIDRNLTWIHNIIINKIMKSTNIGGAAVPDSKTVSGTRKVSSRRPDYDTDDE